MMQWTPEQAMHVAEHFALGVWDNMADEEMRGQIVVQFQLHDLVAILSMIFANGVEQHINHPDVYTPWSEAITAHHTAARAADGETRDTVNTMLGLFITACADVQTEKALANGHPS